MNTIFNNRETAGGKLAEALEQYSGEPDAIVLALPRGGVPVASQVAEKLKLPLDLLIVRKLGVPWHGELAMGAIASGDVRVLNEDVIRSTGVTESQLKAVLASEKAELARRQSLYRGDRPFPELEGKTVLLIDDGLATGATMRAAVIAVEHLGARRIVLAVPVAPADTMRHLRNRVDEVVCLSTPEPFQSIGQWYVHFDQTSDETVSELLARNWGKVSRPRDTSAAT